MKRWRVIYEYTVSFVDLGLSKKNNNIRGVYHAGNHKNNLEKIKSHLLNQKHLV